MEIRYMSEAVNIDNLLAVHGLSMKSFKAIVRKSVNNTFTIEGNEYQIFKKKGKEQPDYQVFKNDKKYKVCSKQSEVAKIVGKSRCIVSKATHEGKTAQWGEWKVKRLPKT